MDETSLRDFDEPMQPDAWRSWKAWTGYKENEPNPIQSSLWPLAFVIWFLLGAVALMVLVREI